MCCIGSAAAQKTMPAAIVVHKVIVNHVFFLICGWAFLPPILIFPIGLKYIQTQARSNIDGNKINIHPN
jgi:hypothetical protein